ncbi:MAG: hypothetical protein U1E56_08285 [Bauldia sp.]
MATLPSLTRLSPSTDTNVEARNQYLVELSAMDEVALEGHFRPIYLAELAKWRAEAEERERNESYNLPSARANFEHWARAAFWTLEEAVALCLGRAPEKLSEHILGQKESYSPFAAKYMGLLRLAQRATWDGSTDKHRNQPLQFLAWARRLQIEMDPELLAALGRLGLDVPDWKARYDALRATAESERKRLLSDLEQERKNSTALAATVSDLGAGKPAPTAGDPPASEKPLGARERESLLKLAIGMAVIGYSYDPHASRSNITSEIAGDLEQAGVPLDVDTVRKWLREGADLLPPKTD